MLRVKKFILDYLIGSVLFVLLFILVISNIPAMNTGVIVSVVEECSAHAPVQNVLAELQEFLRDGESCETVSPCVDAYEVQCKGSLTLAEYASSIINQDMLVFRVVKSLSNSYPIQGFRNTSEFVISFGFVMLLVGYGLILIETGALLFSLWRQEKLSQTFTLPPGLKKNQLIKPAFLAIFVAVLVLGLNYLVFDLFNYPVDEKPSLFSLIAKYPSGVFWFVVLAPLAEEIIFRGVLLRFFVERGRLLLGIVIVSLLFSVFHGFSEESLGWQLYISSIYFSLSVVLCRLYISQKTIWSPIVFHSAYNSTLVLFSFLFF